MPNWEVLVKFDAEGSASFFGMRLSKWRLILSTRTRFAAKKNTAPPDRVAPCRIRCRGGLELHDVLRRRAFLGLNDFELDALTLGQ